MVAAGPAPEPLAPLPQATPGLVEAVGRHREVGRGHGAAACRGDLDLRALRDAVALETV